VLCFTGSSTAAVACRGACHGSRRAPLPPLRLCQAAVEACVSSLRLLQEHKTLLPTRSLVLHSSGSAALEPPPGAPRSAVATVGAAAVLGIMKCLPYELPSLTVAPLDADAAVVDAPSAKNAFLAVSGYSRWVSSVLLPSLCCSPA
jgi:hypothetical protein